MDFLFFYYFSLYLCIFVFNFILYLCKRIYGFQDYSY